MLDDTHNRLPDALSGISIWFLRYQDIQHVTDQPDIRIGLFQFLIEHFFDLFS